MPQLMVIQVVEKIFPFLSLFLVSKLFSLKEFDAYGVAVIFTATVVSWATSGIGVAATKAAVKNDQQEINSLISLSRLFSLLSIIVFLVYYLLTADIHFLKLLILGFTSYFAAISILRKTIMISQFNWKFLFRAYLISLLLSIVGIYIISIFAPLIPEVILFLFYFPLSILLRKPNTFKMSLNEYTFKYFYKELGPLYLTGIMSGSMLFLLTTIAIKRSAPEGTAGLIAIGFQLISIVQFIPMAVNRLFFISVNAGKKINLLTEISKLFFYTLITGVPLYFTLPLLGADYKTLSGYTYFFVIAASLASSFSTLFGSLLVARGIVIPWTIITFLASLLGILTMVLGPELEILNLVFLAIVVTYFVQFLLGLVYYEKHRILRF